MKQREGIAIESYFEFMDSGEIRLKGTRVGIEIVLRDYLGGAGPEKIVLRYPTLSLEQVHATILYYLHNTEELDDYLKEWKERGEAAWQEQQHHPSNFAQAYRGKARAIAETARYAQRSYTYCMSKIRFLLDEHINRAVQRQLRRLDARTHNSNPSDRSF